MCAHIKKGIYLFVYIYILLFIFIYEAMIRLAIRVLPMFPVCGFLPSATRCSGLSYFAVQSGFRCSGVWNVGLGILVLPGLRVVDLGGSGFKDLAGGGGSSGRRRRSNSSSGRSSSSCCCLSSSLLS